MASLIVAYHHFRESAIFSDGPPSVLFVHFLQRELSKAGLQHEALLIISVSH